MPPSFTWEYSDIRIALVLTCLMAALGGLTLSLLPRTSGPMRPESATA